MSGRVAGLLMSVKNISYGLHPLATTQSITQSGTCSRGRSNIAPESTTAPNVYEGNSVVITPLAESTRAVYRYRVRDSVRLACGTA
ncbi:hypothetical protein ACVWWN_003911 [Mycobacterium sp. URHB0021]